MRDEKFKELAKEIADCSETLEQKVKNLSNLMKVNDIMNKHSAYKRMNQNNKIALCITICRIVNQSQISIMKKQMNRDVSDLDLALE